MAVAGYLTELTLAATFYKYLQFVKPLTERHIEEF